MTNLYTLPKDELVRLFVEQATALRDQNVGASAVELAETALAVARRQPGYQHWGSIERCPEEPMIDLMRRVMNGDGFLAATAGEIRAAANAQPSRHPLFDRLAALGLAPLPRELPGGDGAQVLLYDVKRNTVLSAVRDRDEAALARDVERLLRDVDRDPRDYEEARWLASRD